MEKIKIGSILDGRNSNIILENEYKYHVLCEWKFFFFHFFFFKLNQKLYRIEIEKICDFSG